MPSDEDYKIVSSVFGTAKIVKFADMCIHRSPIGLSAYQICHITVYGGYCADAKSLPKHFQNAKSEVGG